jgi:hypothetical protein
MLKSHPYFWSLYVVSGDTSGIKVQRKLPTTYLTIGLGIVLLLIIYALIKRKSVKAI